MAKKFSEMSESERRECGRKGGIASGEAKRRKKAMRERLNILLEMALKGGRKNDLEAIKNFSDLKGANVSVSDAILIAQIQKAMKGDTTAATFIRDTSGEKPSDDFRVEAGQNLLDAIRASTADSLDTSELTELDDG